MAGIDGVGTVVVSFDVSGEIDRDSEGELEGSPLASEVVGIDGVGNVVVSFDVSGELDGDSEGELEDSLIA